MPTQNQERRVSASSVAATKARAIPSVYAKAKTNAGGTIAIAMAARSPSVGVSVSEPANVSDARCQSRAAPTSAPMLDSTTRAMSSRPQKIGERALPSVG